MEAKNAIKFIVNKLEKELPKKLSYHGVEHTKYVIKSAKKLSVELQSEEDRSLLLTACAFHDSGFLVKYTENESCAVDIVKRELPQFSYSEKQIEIVGNMILATKIKSTPKTHLEQLMCDADYFYFGGKKYHEIADMLRNELNEFLQITYSNKEWIEKQILFLENHTYYTKTAIESRTIGKKKVVDELNQQLLAC